MLKNPPVNAGDGREDPLEEKMVTHSSLIAWIIPWTEETGGLQSMGLQKLDTTDHAHTIIKHANV